MSIIDDTIFQKRMKYAYCITKLEDACEMAYIQDSDGFVRAYNSIVKNAWELGDENVRAEIQRLSTSTDVLFLADQLMQTVIPLLKEMVMSLEINDIQITPKYKLVPTPSGFFTLYNCTHNRYIHSALSPYSTAHSSIKAFYNPLTSHYYCWGIGLGYELLALYEISNGSVIIDAFERDPEVYECAKTYGVLGNIPEGVVNYHVGTSVSEFVNITSGMVKGIYINLPSYYALDSIEERNELMNLVSQQSTLLRMGKQLEINIRHNVDMKLPSAESFIPNKPLREIIVVAGGPSLDANMQYLKQECGNKCIFSVGTVYEKLMNSGIVPDAVFVCDYHEVTTRQFVNMWNSDVPLILDAVANWKLAAKYTGPRYIAWSVLAHSTYSSANDYSKGRIYPSCRTVTSFAISYAISLNPEIVTFIGVDLGYPGGMSHATGTKNCHKVHEAGLFEVEANNGDVILSNNVFTTYRQEIEEMIAHNDSILFRNKSDVGARIQGAQWIPSQT